MTEMTAAQGRKIFALARGRGIDGGTPRGHVNMLTGQAHISGLPITDAVKVTGSLEGKAGTARGAGRMTVRQHRFINSLMVTLGWTDAEGKPDTGGLRGFVKSKSGVDDPGWLDIGTASKVIEGLEAVVGRKRLCKGV
jgi:hypothetical protein